MNDAFHYSGISSLLRLELINLRISEQIVVLPALINYADIGAVNCDLCLFTFSITIPTSKALGSFTNVSAVCISVCLTLLISFTMKNWEKWILHLAKILWDFVNKSHFSSFITKESQMKPLKINTQLQYLKLSFGSHSYINSSW